MAASGCGWSSSAATPSNNCSSGKARSAAAKRRCIGQDLCRALAAVHGAGLVHRDVKAQNVIREEGGRLVLMDFGTGLLLEDDEAVQASPIAGTPLYLAPEVLAGADASPPERHLQPRRAAVPPRHRLVSVRRAARWPSCADARSAASASACTTCGPICRKASSTSSSAPSSPIRPSGMRASAPCSAASPTHSASRAASWRR